MIYIYNAIIYLVFALYFPVFCYQYFIKKKYHGYFWHKLGLKKISYKKGSPVIWVHAVSVGEIKAASTLLKLIKEKYPASVLIVSSVTQTGHNEAIKTAPFADHHLFLPLDLKFIMKRFLKGVTPDLVLLIENDIWPNFLSICKKKGAKIGLLSATVSERSFKRLSKVQFFSKWYYSFFDFCLPQDEIYYERFKSCGFNEEKLTVIPNLKLDDIYDELDKVQLATFKKSLGLTTEPCLVVGSTHQPEEKLILEQIVPLFDKYPTLKVLLVPRHPERFDEVESLLKRKGYSYCRFSKKGDVNKKIILIDTMGLLRHCYQLSTIAIVAGSFNSSIGGHNVLEPLWFSTPSIFGPHTHKQSQFVRLALKARAARQMPIEDLKESIHELLHDSFKREQMGRRGKEIFTQASGGTRQTLEILQKILEHKEDKE